MLGINIYRCEVCDLGISSESGLYKHALTHKGEAEAKKFDDNKAPMELLSHQALAQIAEVFGHGAIKYGKHNYKKGLAWSRVIGAAYRHLGAFNSGEDLDPESGRSHIAHLGCCVIMLLDFIKEHKELDDRYVATSSKTE